MGRRNTEKLESSAIRLKRYEGLGDLKLHPATRRGKIAANDVNSGVTKM